MDDKKEQEIKGLKENFTEYQKLVGLLTSGIKENIDLAMTVLKHHHPAMWCALLNYTGIGEVNEEILKKLSIQGTLSLGNRVKYRGMENCPQMVVTHMALQPQKSAFGNNYYTKVTCKYFNKSTQTFVTIEDRMECFEIL